MERINQININNEGLIYINSNLRINAIKLALHRRFVAATASLIQKLKACQDNQCLKNCQDQYSQYLSQKESVLQSLSQKQQKFKYEYLLCGELIYDNDVKVCRRNIKDKYVRDVQIAFEQKYNF